MKQYWDVKSAHTDKILFFRMGDFYELFDQDAITAAPILGIALTSRNKNQEDATALCGMPYHSVAQHINKLLSLNFKVAICDQIEDPALAKGIVQRAVTRILSPGMVYDPNTLDQAQNNYLCSFDNKTVSFLDATTGEAFFYQYPHPQELQKLISILNPVEMVLKESDYKKVLEDKKSLTGPCLSEHNDLLGDEKLHESSRRLLSYAVSMQGQSLLQTLQNFEERYLVSRMELGSQVLKHLEIFKTYQGEDKGSFFSAINKTKTAAGARKLKNWILFPLLDQQEILKRQKVITSWYQNVGFLKQIRQILSLMGDIERRMGKISNPTCNARDLISLKESLRSGLEVSSLAQIHQKQETQIIYEIVKKIEETIVSEPPVLVRGGHIIQKGYSQELDELISLTEDAQSLLQKMEQEEKEKYQIPSLKIRYNQVFGFYIEVTKTHIEKVPKHYIRKQTLTNAERYTTDELHRLEGKVLTAKTKREELEFHIFENLCSEILKKAPQILKLAHDWSEVDVCSSLAWLALEMNYVAPEFAMDRSLDLKASRHPVIEQFAKSQFVSNDIYVHPHGCLLLTGPNMAGKSTIMRQVALTAILAQIGSYVPAEQARLPLFDRIYTRIGASDFLTEGLSTFMVEMTETAYLLKNATNKSLVILDEIGRGTSTYDGMSLAQSILEYLVTQVSCMTFFATHYHELTNLAGAFSQIQNVHMKVAEKNHEITFLYTLTRGPANKSYGIEVARLAGLPVSVTNRAKKILEGKEQLQSRELPLFSTVDQDASCAESLYNNEKFEKILLEIQSSSLNQMTPLEAMNMIANWQKSLN